mgnify:FL=1
MEIQLPLNINKEEPVISANSLVVIGTNGAGKSSFGRALLTRYADRALKISGLHALFITGQPDEHTPSDEWMQLQMLIKERLLLPRITEYEKMILRLQREEFEAAVNYKEACKLNAGLEPPATKIDVIQQIWEQMFPHNRLIRKSGFIELTSAERSCNSYTAGRMSDSEKLVFYLIAAGLYAPANALLVIEEPETLLHSSIKNLLWDKIEELRPDCTFVYLTHDIDFALADRKSVV